MRKFNHLNVPDQWNNYFTRYPQGYTILESLLNWVTQVDDMVENQNALNKTVADYRVELDDFVERFDPRLQEEVTKTLGEWQDSGFLDVVISQALQTQITKVESDLAQIVKQKESISIEHFISDDLTMEESFTMALGYVEENEVSLYIPSENFTLENWIPYKASKPIKIIGSEVGESRIINNGESLNFIESDTSGVYRFVTFENFYSIHFMTQEKEYIPYVVFDNCFFVAGSNKHENGVTLGGVSWNDGKDGVSIGRLIITNCNSDTTLVNSTVSFDYALVSDNKITNALHRGISLGRESFGYWRNAFIERNTIKTVTRDTPGYSLGIITFGENHTIKDNHVSDVKRLPLSDGFLTGQDRADGIYTKAINSEVSGNTLVNIYDSQGAINIKADGVSCFNNNIFLSETNSSQGINIEGSHVKVHSNTIRKPRIGIRFTDTSTTNIQVTNNVITDVVGAWGIFGRPSKDVEINGNTIDNILHVRDLGEGTRGINYAISSILNSAENIEISNNIIRGNQKLSRGISFYAPDTELKNINFGNNTLSNMETGILVASTNSSEKVNIFNTITNNVDDKLSASSLNVTDDLDKNVEVIHVTRDLSIVGNQVLGIIRPPKMVKLAGVVSSSNKISFGTWSEGLNSSIYYYSDFWGVNTGRSLWFRQTGSSDTSGAFVYNDVTGEARLQWAINGEGATGLADITIEIYY